MPVKVTIPPAVEPLTLAEAKHHLRIDHQEGATWAADTDYIVGDIIDGTNHQDYICTDAHTAAAANRPITGASWESYWSAYGADDDYITSLIKAVREYCEWTLLGRALITQTLQYNTNAFRPVIRLPMPPLSTITGFTYKDSAGNSTTMVVEDDYIVDTNEEPAVLTPPYGKSWPSVALYPLSPITIVYTAGYGATAASVPEEVKHWMRLMIGHYYENREAILPMGHNIQKTPYGINWLLQGLRTWGRADA